LQLAGVWLRLQIVLKQKEAQRIFVLNNLLGQGRWVEIPLYLAILAPGPLARCLFLFPLPPTQKKGEKVSEVKAAAAG